MILDILKQVKIAIFLLLLMTVITGVIYPALVTGIGQIVFPWKANGSLIELNGHVIGSELIGQAFTDAKYFNSRPSATAPFPYNALSSSGSNLGPSNPDLLRQVTARVAAIKQQNPDSANGLIPIDLVTTSASGLDPDISPAAAYYQSARIAQARGVDKQVVDSLIANHTQFPLFGIFGEARVNVLKLNLALDKQINKR